MIVKAKGRPQRPKNDNCAHQNITPEKIYCVIEISLEHFRVVNDRKEPILYPKYLFDTVDCRLPAGWCFEEFDDGEYFIGPAELSKAGFYEDLFDRIPEAKLQFDRALEKMLQDFVFKDWNKA